LVILQLLRSFIWFQYWIY